MFIQRILGVFKLSSATFEDIEHDPNATVQALMVVLAAAILSGLGSGFTGAGSERGFIGAFIGGLIWTLIGWALWSGVSYFIGTTLFHGRATFDEMLRVIGFAFAPQILGVIPCIGSLIGFLWSLVAGFVAVRQGLDVDNPRAAMTILIGGAVYWLGSLLINFLLGGFAPFLGF
jgi:hypothetical protein